MRKLTSFEGKFTSQPLVGVGLRRQHYQAFLDAPNQSADFLEIITENFIDNFGFPYEAVKMLCQYYPLALHGVSLSIGSTDAINWPYLNKVKDLAKDLGPFCISDHLCWTGVGGHNSHDLLPLPYNKETLDHIVSRISEIQDFLGQEILMENPSSYLEFTCSTMTEWEFLNEMAKISGCKILLDVNNVFVSAFNHDFSATQYIDGIDSNAIRQYHIAGHTQYDDYIIDSHLGPVPDGVTELYKYTLQQIGLRPTLLEWDTDVPSYEVLMAEVNRIKNLIHSCSVPIRRDHIVEAPGQDLVT